jgi:poly(hydroxyalkanoate) depolymerase family esterase
MSESGHIRRILCLFSVVAGLTAAAAAQAASMQEVTGFGTNPTQLKMYVYVPAKVLPKPPILVGVHWCHGDAPAFFNGTDFARLADQYGYVMVLPSVTQASDGCFDVASQGTLSHNGGGDSLGIISMVKYAVSHYSGDPTRVYATGVSSGAMMTNVLLGSYPDVFRAGVAFAGVPFACFAGPNSWNADCATGQITRTAQEWGDLVRSAYPGYVGPRPRIQLWHGTADSTLSYVNFGEEIKEWTNVLGVSQTPVTTETDTPQTGWTRTRYGSAGEGAAVEAISLKDVPHGLPVQAAAAIHFFGLDAIGADTVAPSAPTGLTVASKSANAVTLSWTASTDNVAVTGYDVFAGGVQVGSSGGTSATISNLKPSTTYAFSVRARDTAGNASSASSSASVTTSATTGDTSPPAAPAGLYVKSRTTSAVTLAWSPSTDNVAVAGYLVGFSGRAFDGSTQTLQVLVSTAGATISGLAAGTTYTFSVSARDAAGNLSAASTPIVAATSDGSGTPAAELQIQYRSTSEATSGAITSALNLVNVGQVPVTLSNVTIRYWFTADTSASLAWACDFALAGCANYTSKFVKLATSSSTSDTYLELGFATAAGTLAVNQSTGELLSRVTNSAWTQFNQANDYSYDGTKTAAAAWDHVTVYLNGALIWGVEPGGPPADTTAPSAPSGLLASSVTTTGVTLSWSASTDNVAVVAYDVFQDGALIGISGGATSYSVTGLVPGTRYAFTVKARDAAGNSSASSNSLSVGSTCCGDTTPPSAPASLTASDVTSTSVILRWTASTDDVGVVAYEILSGTTVAGTSSTTSATVSNLLPSTAYRLAVRAKDAAGNVSSASAEVAVTTLTSLDLTPPSAPRNLIWAANGMTVTLDWSPSTDDVGVTGYQLYYGNFFLGVFTDTSLALIGFKAATPYVFSLKAVDAAGNVSVASNTATVLLQASVDSTPPTAPSNLTVTNTTDKTISLRWAASTDDVGVVVYQIYTGSTLVGTVPASTSGTISNLQPSTTYTFAVKAVDAAGNVSAASSALTVTTKSSTVVDTTPPSVTLSGSATGTVTAATTLALTATASDDVGVTKVEFYDGATLLGSDTAAPYAQSVSVTAASNGMHAFTAKAYDAVGNAGTSAAVSVVVNIGSGGGGGGGVVGAPVYTAGGGKLLKDGAKLELFGLNWFGMETSARVLHGLWTGRQLADFLSDIQSKGFNALRLPLSPQTINSGYAIDGGPYSGDDCAAMCGKDGRTGLEHVLKTTQAMGIYVLFDFHTCDPAALGSALPGTPIGCSGYTMDKWLADLKTLASLSKAYTNVVGVDLANEPWKLTWTEWASYASQGGQAVLSVNPNTTVWVEGIGNTSTAGVAGGANWGQNLYEAGAISGVPSDKLVYTPHSYGPSVAAMSYFTDAAFPSNMPAIWDTLFGHLVSQGYTVVIGEFGGMYTTGSSSATNDKAWQDAFVTYLIDKGELSSFYWCVNPNSGDTGGVYENDWKTWNTSKVELLQRLMK